MPNAPGIRRRYLTPRWNRRFPGVAGCIRQSMSVTINLGLPSPKDQLAAIVSAIQALAVSSVGILQNARPGALRLQYAHPGNTAAPPDTAADARKRAAARIASAPALLCRGSSPRRRIRGQRTGRRRRCADGVPNSNAPTWIWGRQAVWGIFRRLSVWAIAISGKRGASSVRGNP